VQHLKSLFCQVGILDGKNAMITVNENFLKLQAWYLFPEIGKRKRAFQQAHPDAKLISMGIGDVTSGHSWLAEK
jgi:hypothetical protein